MPQYHSHISTQGINMTGTHTLWRATGIKNEDFSKLIIAIANSFTQFVLGHVHIAGVYRAVSIMGLLGELDHVSLINRDAPAEHTRRLSVNKLNTSGRLMIRFLNSQTGFGGNS